MSTYTKSQSFFWITVAYLCAYIAGGLWLYFFGLNEATLMHAFIADTIATIVIFIFSRIFNNSSFYDAFWSVTPPLLMLYWWLTRDVNTNDTRNMLLAIVMVYWAVRLTWNWIKHWPGLEHEDWRYPIVRGRAPKSLHGVVDFLAIHQFPTIQVFLGLLPVYAVTTLSTRELYWLDYFAFFVGMAAVTIELVADIQLHKFIKTKKPGEIIQTGLWGLSRHPNYLGEFLFWVSLALFGLAAWPEGWWWQILGALAMLIMFVTVSIPMMEERSLERRPEYQKIIDNIPMFFPYMKK